MVPRDPHEAASHEPRDTRLHGAPGQAGPLGQLAQAGANRVLPGVFQADHVEKTRAELSARGVEFAGPPRKADRGTSAIFNPDGNHFGLSSR